MTTDRYTKTVLTVIAIALSMIALNPWIAPTPAKAEADAHPSSDQAMSQADQISRDVLTPSGPADPTRPMSVFDAIQAIRQRTTDVNVRQAADGMVRQYVHNWNTRAKGILRARKNAVYAATAAGTAPEKIYRMPEYRQLNGMNQFEFKLHMEMKTAPPDKAMSIATELVAMKLDDIETEMIDKETFEGQTLELRRIQEELHDIVVNGLENNRSSSKIEKDVHEIYNRICTHEGGLCL
jgi:hypothetical protein